MRQVPLPRLCDVNGEITHAFKIAVDLDGGHDRAEVNRHRLVKGQQFETPVVDFKVEPVNVVVPSDYVGEHRMIAFAQPGHRHAHALFGQTTHHEEPVLELLQLLSEVALVGVCILLDRHPNRPVT
jgi:hypothetical protein